MGTSSPSLIERVLDDRQFLHDCWLRHERCSWREFVDRDQYWRTNWDITRETCELSEKIAEIARAVDKLAAIAAYMGKDKDALPPLLPLLGAAMRERENLQHFLYSEPGEWPTMRRELEQLLIRYLYTSLATILNPLK